MSGGLVFDEEPFKAYAPNITPDRETGIGGWTDAQLARSIREGIRPDGSVIGPPMPIMFYRGLADDEERGAEVRAPSRKDAVKYGEYLAGPLGHCMDCHTPWVKGVPDMKKVGAGGNPRRTRRA